jgi:hypothetical protein
MQGVKFVTADSHHNRVDWRQSETVLGGDVLEYLPADETHDKDSTEGGAHQQEGVLAVGHQTCHRLMPTKIVVKVVGGDVADGERIGEIKGRT